MSAWQHFVVFPLIGLVLGGAQALLLRPYLRRTSVVPGNFFAFTLAPGAVSGLMVLLLLRRRHNSNAQPAGSLG